MSGLDDDAVNRLTERLAYLDRYERTARAMGHIDRADTLAEDIAMFRGAITAIARDAQVREIVARALAADPDDVVPMSYAYADGMDDVITLYPEVASMLRDGKG